jgi:hypothetical protein
MAKLTLNDVTTGYQSTAAVNTNNALVEAALENTISRDGTAPNTMTGSLDMNGQSILNLGNPIVIDGWDWTGPWGTSTVYAVGDVVESSGTSYICIVAHTSGTFSTDLGNTKWQLVATATLPTQTSHSGKYLTTNGSSASWGTVTIPASAIPAGTRMLFIQAAAPTGWTQDVTYNDRALRVVSTGAGNVGGATGGSVDFETAFASQTPSGTTNAIALTIAQMPAHTHTQQLPTSNGAAGSSSGSPVSGVTGVTSSSTGGGATHSHAFSGNAINLDVSYINIILCSKD